MRDHHPWAQPGRPGHLGPERRHRQGGRRAGSDAGHGHAQAQGDVYGGLHQGGLPRAQDQPGVDRVLVAPGECHLRWRRGSDHRPGDGGRLQDRTFESRDGPRHGGREGALGRERDNGCRPSRLLSHIRRRLAPPSGSRRSRRPLDRDDPIRRPRHRRPDGGAPAHDHSHVRRWRGAPMGPDSQQRYASGHHRLGSGGEERGQDPAARPLQGEERGVRQAIPAMAARAAASAEPR